MAICLIQLRLHSFRDLDGHSVFDVLEHLIVAQALEREAAKGDDFVKQNAVRPNVRHGSEQSVHLIVTKS